MQLRGLLYRKIKAKPQKKLSPELQKAYNAAYRAEIQRRDNARKEAQMTKIQEKAKRDAYIASTTRGKRVAGGLLEVGRKLGERVDKFDTEKFEAFVTGVGTSKKKK